MRKRILIRRGCLLLVCALLGGLLAGCPAEEPLPETTEAPKETTAPTTVPTTVPTEPVIETTAPTEYIGLTMLTPLQNVTTVDEYFVLTGLSDPSEPVYVNGEEVRRDETGGFSYPAPLQPGYNTLEVTHKAESVTYQVNRRYCVQYYSPQYGKDYGSGATVFLRIAVREGSQVTATFRGENVELYKTVDQLGTGLAEGFELYRGEYYLPAYNTKVLDLGAITYTVTCDGITESYTSGDMTCQPVQDIKLIDYDVTPEGYRNVGSGYIVEIVDTSVETFNGRTNDDRSNPTYNYLPEGTVDYGYPEIIYSPSGEQSYRLLRCGVRVYAAVKNVPVQSQRASVDCYTGTLPDHNEINISSMEIDGHHSILTLDCLWKAPFFFDFEPQEYQDETTRRYIVEKFDPTYIDIRFCYATVVDGDLSVFDNTPLFSHAEWIDNGVDHTLRLYLKKEGGLYGWDAYYNEYDQLCFKFLNPVLVEKADNAYGADLTGVRVMIDVGHGGVDVGAAGVSGGLGYLEKNRNLELAEYLKKELESIGATVIMNRTEDTMTTQRERILFLKEQAPDYCIAIHHNSAEDKSRNGFEAGFFTIFSQRATEHIHMATDEADIYNSSYVMWFYYYVSRQTICPNVLTECGYMSNQQDMDEAIDPDILTQKAQSMCQGIVNYYLELSELYSK